MYKINDNYQKLPGSYLFSTIGKKVSAYSAAHPEKKIIRLGIGDVTLPLAPAIIEALQAAVDEMGRAESFRGYAPDLGYDFLREAIAENDYRARKCDIGADEIFVSDGAKCDSGNIQEIFSLENRIAVRDPVYPVYVDTNVMAGRAGRQQPDGCWSNIEYLPCTAENSFVPPLPLTDPDVIYLCYPNNPTGTTLTRSQLKLWVDYALEHGSLILFDSAYEAYITSDDVPHSIYEIEGARRCAIEFRSFSKTAGFTGLRLGYTVVPSTLCGVDSEGNSVSLRQLWLRRQTTKFNGASYVVQRAAEAIYTPEGQRQVAETIAYYHRNAAMLREGLASQGLEVYGGTDAPYIWVRTPEGMSSWDFFYLLLERCHVVCTPGVGFGPSGEGYCRFTAFSSAEATEQAVERIKHLSLK